MAASGMDSELVLEMGINTGGGGGEMGSEQGVLQVVILLEMYLAVARTTSLAFLEFQQIALGLHDGEIPSAAM